ncbi:MAG TPA: FAD-dependent oxidoreductase [Candidatus Dormibacteraeota bacterium]|nr:FAD-dependent oxidoreductase [Candidatus Dormibacteraeota bacterium]
MVRTPDQPPDSIAVALSRVAGRETDAAEFAGAFPYLDDGQIEKLRPYGREERVGPGDVLFTEGQLNADFTVVLEGEMAAVAHYGPTGDPVGVPFKPGQFVGVMNILSREGAYVTVSATMPSRVLRITLDRLRDLMGEDVTLSEIVLRAFLLRHTLLMRLGTGPKIIGSHYNTETRQILDLLARNRIAVTWLDLESNPGAENLLQGFGLSVSDTPVVLVAGRPMLKNPTLTEVADVFGITRSRDAGDEACDLVVVGAGPAGLAAAVYAGSEGLNTVVVEGIAIGGQAGTSSRIENYLGFPAGLSGQELAARAALQAQKFAAAIMLGSRAVALDSAAGMHSLRTSDGRTLNARAVVIATGARYRRLEVPRLSDFEGAGVYYAATEVEARSCRDAVAVVGAGNSAGQAAVFMAQKGCRVHLIVRGSSLEASMSRYLIDEIERKSSIEIHLRTQVRELVGDDGLEGVEIESDAVRSRLRVTGLFSFIGAEPNSEWLSAGVQRDEHGFVLTGLDVPGQAGASLTLETSVAGVFAVGDIRHGSIKRVATAVGEGAMAVRLVHERLAAVARGA